MTFVQATFVHINISHLLLSQLGPNFKGKFLGQFSTETICHGDICCNNMSQQHLSITSISQLLLIRFGPNFKGSVHGTIFNRSQVFWVPKFFGLKNFSGPKIVFWPKFFLWPKSVFRLKLFSDQKFFLTQNFFPTKNFSNPNFFYHFLQTHIFFQTYIFLSLSKLNTFDFSLVSLLVNIKNLVSYWHLMFPTSPFGYIVENVFT